MSSQLGNWMDTGQKEERKNKYRQTDKKAVNCHFAFSLHPNQISLICQSFYILRERTFFQGEKDKKVSVKSCSIKTKQFMISNTTIFIKSYRVNDAFSDYVMITGAK